MCWFDDVFGKDVDEIVQICNDMICVFIYTYHMISFFYIYFLQTCIIYIYIKLNFFLSGLSLFSAESFIQRREERPGNQIHGNISAACVALKNHGEISKGKACHLIIKKTSREFFVRFMYPPKTNRNSWKNMFLEKKNLFYKPSCLLMSCSLSRVVVSFYLKIVHPFYEMLLNHDFSWILV